MSKASANFQHIDSLKNHIEHNQNGAIMISYSNVEDYPGMVRAISIVFDTSKNNIKLSIEWMSLGLDLYGDTLQECYIYQFHHIESLLSYLEKKFQIRLHDIPIQFQFDQNLFPSPLKDEDNKPLYEAAWERFQDDFKAAKFYDKNLELSYSSLD